MYSIRNKLLLITGTGIMLVTVSGSRQAREAARQLSDFSSQLQRMVDQFQVA